MFRTVCSRLSSFMDETRSKHKHSHLYRQHINFTRFTILTTLRYCKPPQQQKKKQLQQKCSFVIFQASSTYTLQIKDIQETDAGFYMCQVLISSTNHISAEVELQVRRPPIISDNSTRSIVVSEGEGNLIII